MRLALLLVLVLVLVLAACGSSSKPPPAAPPAKVAAVDPAPDPAPITVATLCRDLDRGDLEVRRSASRQLQDRIGAVEGGTEQQMEAAGEYCEQETVVAPSWMPG